MTLQTPEEYITIEITMVHKHGRLTGRSVTVRGKRRCSLCGHRLTVNGIPPVRSRELPMRTWHQEIIDRHRARRHQ